MKCGCASREPEVGKSILPSDDGGAAAIKHRTHRDTEQREQNLARRLRGSVVTSHTHLEAYPEGHLRDPHEAGLLGDLTEAAAAEPVFRSVGLHVVVDVEELDAQLRARPTARYFHVLAEHDVGVVAVRRPDAVVHAR